MPRQVAHNQDLASDVARLNLVTNGGFENWQRGSGSAFSTTGPSGTYTADRWQIFVAGTGTISIIADASNQDVGSWRCAIVTCSGSPSVASPHLVYQNLISTFASGEGQELRGRICSATARVRTTTPSGVRLCLLDATGSGSNYSGYHSGSGVYETLRVSMPTPWSSNCINGQVRFEFAANGTYYLDNVMVVVGSVPCDYIPQHPADDFARCQRYYEFLGAVTLLGFAVTGQTGSFVSTGLRWVNKPVTPTVTKGAGYTGGWSDTNSSSQIDRIGASGGRLMVAPAAVGGFESWGGLTIEANP